MRTTRLVALVVLFGGFAISAAAQQTRATVLENAPIVLLPDRNRTPLRVAAVGTQFVVLSEEGDWLQVEFQDPQFGRRVGYVERRLVRIALPAKIAETLSPSEITVQGGEVQGP